MNSKKSLLGMQAEGSERRHEEGLRPATLADFQGQTNIKDNLAVFIQAALQRQEAMDHLFISGPPGLGKTTLAGIVARELGVEMKHTSAPILDKPRDLAGLLTTLPPRSLFFIDELHRLKPAIEEMLYSAMEDGQLDLLVGKGAAARSVRIPLPPFTLVGATTRPGSVSTPMITRFGITIRINFYQEKELISLLLRSAKILDIQLSNAAAALLASSSRATPRIANRLLRRMRDFAQIEQHSCIEAALVQRSLERLEVDNLGLERLDRSILETIIDKFSGGPVGGETLAIAVGESIESLEDFHEPYLIQCGLIERTARGRVATNLAYRHLQLKRKGNEQSRLLF